MIRLLRRTVMAALLVAGVLVAAGTTPAAAAPEVCNIGSRSVCVTLTNNAGREVVTITDYHADGHSAVARIVASGRAWVAWNPHGAGQSASLTLDPDLPAGTPIQMWACLGESGPSQVMWDTCGSTTQNAGAAATSSGQRNGVVAGRDTGVASSSSTAPKVTTLAENLKVMTWNIGRGAGFFQLDGWTRTIGQAAPHVVGIQETCFDDAQTLRDRLLAEYGLDYEVYYGTFNDNPLYCLGSTMGQVMLSRKPVSQLGTDPFDAQEPSDELRGYMFIEITVDGQPVRVYNTHLIQAGLNPGVRDASSRELATATMATPRAIVLGDFNTEPQNDRSTLSLPPAQQKAMVPLFNAGFRDVDRDCFRNTNPDCSRTQIGSNKKYDYALMRLLTETAQPSIPNTEFSDHRPVIGTVALSPGSTSAQACNYGSCISDVTFQPTGEHLIVNDTNANGLSAVAVYWVQGRGSNQTVVWNPHGSDSPSNPVDVNLDITDGQWITYMSCSGWYGTSAENRQVFWDTCGDQRINIA